MCESPIGLVLHWTRVCVAFLYAPLTRAMKLRGFVKGHGFTGCEKLVWTKKPRGFVIRARLYRLLRNYSRIASFNGGVSVFRGAANTVLGACDPVSAFNFAVLRLVSGLRAGSSCVSGCRPWLPVRFRCWLRPRRAAGSADDRRCDISKQQRDAQQCIVAAA